MMLKQLMNRQCGYLSERHVNSRMVHSSPISLSEEEKAELVKSGIERQRTKKIGELISSLTLISQITEVLSDLDGHLSPLAITALGNMAEQAASTLKLMEKGK